MHFLSFLISSLSLIAVNALPYPYDEGFDLFNPDAEISEMSVLSSDLTSPNPYLVAYNTLPTGPEAVPVDPYPLEQQFVPDGFTSPLPELLTGASPIQVPDFAYGGLIEEPQIVPYGPFTQEGGNEYLLPNVQPSPDFSIPNFQDLLALDQGFSNTFPNVCSGTIVPVSSCCTPQKGRPRVADSSTCRAWDKNLDLCQKTANQFCCAEMNGKLDGCAFASDFID